MLQSMSITRRPRPSATPRHPRHDHTHEQSPECPLHPGRMVLNRDRELLHVVKQSNFPARSNAYPRAFPVLVAKRLLNSNA